MNQLTHPFFSFATTLLLALPTAAQSDPVLSISHVPGERGLTLEAKGEMPADLRFLLLGFQRIELQIGTATVRVMPVVALPMPADGLRFDVELFPGAAPAYAQVFEIGSNWVGDAQMRTSNVLKIDSTLDEPRCAAAQGFKLHAQLISTDGIPPSWSLALALTTRTGGYELVLDRVERREDATSVYVRLVAPEPGTTVTYAFAKHALAVSFEGNPGLAVEVLFAVDRSAEGLPIEFARTHRFSVR